MCGMGGKADMPARCDGAQRWCSGSVRKAVLALFLCCAMAGAYMLAHDRLLSSADSSFLRWRDPAVVVHGHALYRSHCASCHAIPGGNGANLSISGAPPHDESGHTWQHPDHALFQLVRDGVAVANCVPVDPERMPKFRDVISDADLIAILSFIKSTWPEETRQHHDQVNRMYASYNLAVGKLIGADLARD